MRTPSGGLHAIFTGTTQHSAHLPASHVDFLAAGGYVLMPLLRVGGRPYQFIGPPGGSGAAGLGRAVTAPCPPTTSTGSPRTPAPAPAAS